MTRERKCVAARILAAILILGVPLTAYVAGYFWLGERKVFELTPGPVIPAALGKSYVVTRFYNKEWQATIYKPAAMLETWLTRVHVGTGTPTY